MNTADRKVWREIVKTSPDGAITASDRIILEVVCRLVVEFRAGHVTKASEVAQLLSGLGRLGLTPQDRTKLRVEPNPSKPDESDPFEFLN